MYTPWCRRRHSPLLRMETTTVGSMPTGHQVMQRPQPTQPEQPTFSVRVDGQEQKVTLDELLNDITGATPASFEPSE